MSFMHLFLPIQAKTNILDRVIVVKTLRFLTYETCFLHTCSSPLTANSFKQLMELSPKKEIDSFYLLVLLFIFYIASI